MSGLDDWTGSADWKHLTGALVNGSTNTDSELWIPAPYRVERLSAYAVEADIEVVRFDDSYCRPHFGVVTRGNDQGAYWSGVILPDCGDGTARIAPVPSDSFFDLWNNVEVLTESGFDPEQSQHTYRVEVQGSTIKLLVDGSLLLETTDNRHLAGEPIGLWSFRTQLNIRRFAVIAL